MPILAGETAVLPTDLLDDPSIEPCQGRWWVIYTKSRQEKALARELFRWRIPFYLPLVPKDNFIRGRVVSSFVPLFAGYLFLFAPEEEPSVRILTTNRVSRILPVENQERLWRDLRQVYRLVQSGAPLAVEHRITLGQRVRVKAGAMRGMEGVAIDCQGECRLLVAVNFLRQGASVAVDRLLLDPVP